MYLLITQESTRAKTTIKRLVEHSCCIKIITDGDLKPLSGISKSQARHLVLVQIQEEKESVNSKLARGHVSKLLLEVAIDLGLNLIVKTSILLWWMCLP